MGFTSVGFPNFPTLLGPHNGSTFCNIPRCIEQNVEGTTELIRFMREKGHRRVGATGEAEEEWTDHVIEVGSMTLLARTDSRFTRVDVNLPGRKRTILQYMGGAPLPGEM